MINLFIYENVIVIGAWDFAKLVIDFYFWICYNQKA